MITIKNNSSIQKMEMAGLLLAEVFDLLKPSLVAGVSTQELDALIVQLLIEKKLISQMRGYRGYKHVSCISINDVVVHGIPAAYTILKDGDLVKVDVCAAWQGYCADMARCFFVGIPDKSKQHFVEVAQMALDKGIEQAKPGNKLSDISAAIQQEVEKYGYGVVRDFAGHGIGKKMHEDPEILNYGKPGNGPILKPGMAFALEPMITMGKFNVYIAEDGWTVKTSDKSLAAHVEDTIIIMENGPRIVTRSKQV